MLEECNKYGNVVHIYVDKTSSEVSVSQCVLSPCCMVLGHCVLYGIVSLCVVCCRCCVIVCCMVLCHCVLCNKHSNKVT